jgi:CRISPR-associated protein Cmr2
MSQYFHFTLGPVQSFVAQARRTRDFWAGSFILSWLSAVAMREVQKQDGDGSIVFPKPDKAFLGALEKDGKGPRQGSVPNRFKATWSGNQFGIWPLCLTFDLLMLASAEIGVCDFCS